MKQHFKAQTKLIFGENEQLSLNTELDISSRSPRPVRTRAAADLFTKHGMKDYLTHERMLLNIFRSEGKVREEHFYFLLFGFHYCPEDPCR